MRRPGADAVRRSAASAPGDRTKDPLHEFLAGIGDLARGFRFLADSPRLMLLGAVPALIVGAIWAALLLWLFVSIDGVAAAVTPFAAEWADPWRSVVRALAGLTVFMAALVVAVLTFTAVVLTVGDPFYERISTAAERRLGDAPPDRDEPLLRGLARAATEGLRPLVLSLGVGVLTLALGFVPVAGPALAFLTGALLGGRLVALELTRPPLDRRGLDRDARRAVLRRGRARTLGFGVATSLLFLVPFGAVIATPAAVGGAVVLTRRLLARNPAPGD